jgi:hypothetical protein
MSPVPFILTSKGFDKVVYPAWLPLLIRAWLECDGRGGVEGHSESEGKGVAAPQFLEKSFLKTSLRSCLLRLALGMNQSGGEMEVLLELETHDLILLTPISEGANELSKDLSISQVLVVNNNHAV